MTEHTPPPTAPAGPPPGRGRLVLRELRAWRPTVARLGELLRSAVTSFVVLAGTLWLLPGVDANGLTAVLWVVVLVACVGALLRPLLLALATVLGGLAVLIMGACVQTVVFYVALSLAPQAHLAGLPAAFAASWTAVALAAIVNWLTDAGTDDAFVGETRRLMRKVRRAAAKHGTPSGGDGLVVVQLDGVSTPLLRWAVRAGNLPNLGRWLRMRSHRLTSWHTGLPATTPAAQAGILHGDGRGVPAFRWYEKPTGRLMVASRPRDAAEIERRISTGEGLLRDGGASISNVFTGDATAALFTVSRAALPGRATRGYAAFMTSPYGLTRAIALGVGGLLRELYQARAQRLRDIRPRIGRSGAFLALRPLTGILRDVNVSLLAEQMALGTPVIFCDFVDYDEVAHHAGPARPEALDALGRLDQVLGVVQRLSAEAERRYHLVVLSDHGQSQGETFQQRYGESLAQVVNRLVEAATVESIRRLAAAGEPRGAEAGGAPLAAAGGGLPVAVAAGAPAGAETVLTELAGRSAPAAVAGGIGTVDGADGDDPAARTDGTVVVASGNLAMVYFTGRPGKLSRARIEADHPGVLAGLAAHPGIGLVVVGDEEGPVAIGGRGEHHLRDGRVVGEDPLAEYGPYARTDLLRHQGMAHVGDLVLISSVDPTMEEVSAFEELVGSHGGLGGGQNDAFLVYPADWPLTEEPLVGPESLHRQLLAWQRLLGLRPGRAAPQQAGELRDDHHQADRDQHPLPGLGEDGAAEHADAGVHAGPEGAGWRVRQREAAPVQVDQRDGE
ncbi:alkaline phosphatase family protein [Micromonospora sp. NPDC049559]|uniref:alkaline phosphatase family protein n=1 Tax=Micromonospora sp. NPDC049559 TaxID=3155923 RepID=UPI003430637D